MYHYFYNNTTGAIAMETTGPAPVVSEGEWEGYSIRSSETQYSLDHMIKLSDRSFVLNQPLVDQNKATEVRRERDALLASSDFTQLPDSPASTTTWAAYRQLLRDIPDQSGFPNNVTWPTKP